MGSYQNLLGSGKRTLSLFGVLAGPLVDHYRFFLRLNMLSHPVEKMAPPAQPKELGAWVGIYFTKDFKCCLIFFFTPISGPRIHAPNHPSPDQCQRSMSEVQESAQLLAGEQLPRIVLKPLFQGLEISASVSGVVNLTPYDAFVEKVVVKWQQTYGMEALAMKSFSVGSSTDAVLYSERIVCNMLLEERVLVYECLSLGAPV